MRREFGMFVALMALCALLYVFSDHHAFLGQGNIVNTVRQVAMLGILSIGIGFVIITGGIDLSIGSMVGLTGVLIAYFSVSKEDGGRNWNMLGWVTPEPEGDDYAIMPSSVRLSATSILTLVRYRNWIDGYRSDDNGTTGDAGPVLVPPCARTAAAIAISTDSATTRMRPRSTLTGLHHGWDIENGLLKV